MTDEPNIILIADYKRKHERQGKRDERHQTADQILQRIAVEKRDRNLLADALIKAQMKRRLSVDDARKLAKNLKAILAEIPKKHHATICNESKMNKKGESTKNLDRYLPPSGPPTEDWKPNRSILYYGELAKAAAQYSSKWQGENILFLAQLIAGCSFDEETASDIVSQDGWSVALAGNLGRIAERLKRKHQLDDLFLALHNASVTIKSLDDDTLPMVCSDSIIENFDIGLFNHFPLWTTQSAPLGEEGGRVQAFLPKAYLGRSGVMDYSMEVMKQRPHQTPKTEWTSLLHPQAGHLFLWTEIWFCIAPIAGACLMVKPCGSVTYGENNARLSAISKTSEDTSKLVYEIVFENGEQHPPSSKPIEMQYSIMFSVNPEAEADKANHNGILPHGLINIERRSGVLHAQKLLELISQEGVFVNNSCLFAKATAENILSYLDVYADYEMRPLRREDEIPLIPEHLISGDSCNSDTGMICDSFDGNGILPEIYAVSGTIAADLQVNLRQSQESLHRLDHLLERSIDDLRADFDRLKREAKESYIVSVAWIDDEKDPDQSK